MRYLSTLAMACVLACLCGCGGNTGDTVTVGKEFRSLVPPDTKVLAGIDLDKLKAAPIYQRHEKDLNFPLLNGSSERLGFDPRRDVSDVLIAWDGKRALFFVRGSFKPSEVEQKLSSFGAPRTTYKNHQVFGDTRNSLTFLDTSGNKGFAVAGSAGDVQRTIDLEGSSADTVPEELQERLRQVPKSDQLWIVSRGGLPFVDAPMRSDIASALSNIVHFITGATVGVKADTGTHFQIDISCISKQGAQRVHDALRGAIGLGRLSTRDDQRQLLQIYDGINVDQDNAVVHVHADYSGELTDKVFEELGEMRKAVGR